jgi:hypothetical protein
MGIEPQKETGKMKASVLFGAGWENDSLASISTVPVRIKRSRGGASGAGPYV